MALHKLFVHMQRRSTSGCRALAKATSSKDSLLWLCTGALVSAASLPRPSSKGRVQEGSVSSQGAGLWRSTGSPQGAGP